MGARRLTWSSANGCSANGLPGDIRAEGERTRVYAPITSMLVVSVVLTLALWLVRKVGGGP